MKLLARRALALTFFLAAAALAGCASMGGPRVAADYDRAADFSAYRTFSFHQPLGTDEQGYETLVSQRLKAAAQRELEARGYRYVESGGDLGVNFGARLEDKTRVSTPPVSVGAGYGYGYRRYGTWIGYQSPVEVREYTQGTLTVDLVDSRRQQLVWTGSAVGTVTQSARENLDAAIGRGVAAVFAKFPFRAGGGS